MKPVFSVDLNPDQQQAVVTFLLTDRLANYGYDRKVWRRISAQRYRARKSLKAGKFRAIENDFQYQLTPEIFDHT